MSSFTILSFVGGGIRGLASATLLNELYKSYPNVVSSASMLAGTSTGGTIIAALATNKESPQQIIETYLTTDRSFYADHFSNDPTGPAYPIDLFAAGMDAKYGLQKLSDFQKQKLLFTTFNVGQKDSPWEPVLLHNFPKSTTADTRLADAVVATSSMPGMFGAYKFGSYPGTVDGAFVNHDPTLAAIALAINSGVPAADIVAICFGTGLMPNYLGSETTTWGAQQWQQGPVNAPLGAYDAPPSSSMEASHPS